MRLFPADTKPKRRLQPASTSPHPPRPRMWYRVILRPQSYPGGWVVALLVGGMVLGLGLLPVLKPWQWFVIRKITCQWDTHECPETTYKALSHLRGQPVLSFDPHSIERSLIRNNPEIAQVRIHKRLSATIAVTLTSRTPVATLQDNRAYQYLVDANYVVFAKDKDLNLPIIRTQEAVTVGETIVNPLLVTAVRILQILSDSGLSIQSVTPYSQDRLEVELTSSQLALFTAEKELSNQVDALQYILRTSKMKGIDVHYVDLRYDNPVVR